MSSSVASLDAPWAEQVTGVLSNAFAEYPVMRFVIGADAENFDMRVRAMMNFFVMARVHRGEHMFGIFGDDELQAAALVSRPGGSQSPKALAALRRDLWNELGAGAEVRYGQYQLACAPFAIDEPHMHINVIGVLDSLRGRGLGRILLDHIHTLSREDPESRGVSLTTEDPANVPFYQHFGYSLLGHNRVSDDLETWGFFRPN